MKVCSAFFESEKVFYGRVARIEEVIDAKDPQWIRAHRFTIEVEKPLKGSVKAVEVVESENSSGRWIADVGQKRVVFASKGNRVWGLCSSIDEPGDDAVRTIGAIEALGKARLSTVEGEVVNAERPAGHMLVVTGNGRSYSGMTDSRGAFRIVVPPGKYQLRAAGLFPFTPYSRDDLAGFSVVPGQCAQFQFSQANPDFEIIRPAAPR
jgi:hypothetical protein